MTGRCTYCERPMTRHGGPRNPLYPTRDHVIPESRGGRQTVPCCMRCNEIKGDMMPDDWAAFCQANPEWWALTRAEIRIAKRYAERRAVRRARLRGATSPVIVPPRLIYGTPDRPTPPMAEPLAALKISAAD